MADLENKDFTCKKKVKLCQGYKTKAKTDFQQVDLT